MSALNDQQGGDHYRHFPIQPVEYIQKNGLSFLAGNIIKYATRYRTKGGADDIRKAIHYCRLILELEYGEQGEVEKKPAEPHWEAIRHEDGRMWFVRWSVPDGEGMYYYPLHFMCDECDAESAAKHRAVVMNDAKVTPDTVRWDYLEKLRRGMP